MLTDCQIRKRHCNDTSIEAAAEQGAPADAARGDKIGAILESTADSSDISIYRGGAAERPAVGRLINVALGYDIPE